MTDTREAAIDLGAIASNYRRLKASSGGGPALAVVKADGYGHGAVPVARTLVDAGADALGTADLVEAVALRRAGIRAPLLCWLHMPGTDFAPALENDIEVAVSRIEQVDALADAVRERGRRDVSVQVKVDTGLSRNGEAPERAGALFTRAAEYERAGLLRVRGLMTHVSNTSPEEDRAQAVSFERFVQAARDAGLGPTLLHAAATAAALRIPEARFSMVRLGIGLYGLTPFDDETSAELGIRPAMTLRAPVAATRRVPAGTGISYGYTHRTTEPTNLALIPLGYGDGIPRQASGGGPVAIGGRVYRNVGRIAMDQFVVDLGQDEVEVGDEAVLFGDAETGVPAADDWAAAASTINYEIVTRIGPRVVRTYS